MFHGERVAIVTKQTFGSGGASRLLELEILRAVTTHSTAFAFVERFGATVTLIDAVNLEALVRAVLRHKAENGNAGGSMLHLLAGLFAEAANGVVSGSFTFAELEEIVDEFSCPRAAS